MNKSRYRAYTYNRYILKYKAYFLMDEHHPQYDPKNPYIQLIHWIYINAVTESDAIDEFRNMYVQGELKGKFTYAEIIVVFKDKKVKSYLGDAEGNRIVY